MTSGAWVRSAFWIGGCKTGVEEWFVSGINETIVPALRAMPGVAAARALWPEKYEDSPPPVACQLLVEFQSREDLDLMLASEERKAMRPAVLALLELFEGSLSHIDYRVP